ncbi:hypothetical protein QBZ16_000906 [Prototheca wickerhamii]|uniref:Autophagy-related protein 101 n=1 Tax=Prototheca wickerhamii TaxID=3111 RepID=A0AAD9MM52_PROWI|nr:hypothetical protein QBZ16_000906 [Prototheca wickerhamii]
MIRQYRVVDGQPYEVDSELFDLTWVHCGDAEVDRKVDEKVAQFTTWLEKNPGKRAQVCLRFYEKRQKAAWFGSQEQRLFWEQWVVGLCSEPEPESPQQKQEQQRRTQKQLEECVLTVVRLVNERRDAIPPVASSAAVTFPFDITIAGDCSRAPLRARAPAAEFAALEAASEAALRADAARGRFRTALAAQGRNRYSDVLPYDDHRVRLEAVVQFEGKKKGAAAASEERASAPPPPAAPAGRGAAGAAPPDPGYINASPLEAPASSGLDAAPWRLIAAQAPLRATCGHFWQAALEAGARDVVQLANYSEAGVVKAHPYHAPAPGWKKVYGPITVKTLRATPWQGPVVVVATLDVSAAAVDEAGDAPGAEEESRAEPPQAPSAGSVLPATRIKVRHWQYTGWPDHGVPRAEHCGALLALVEELVPVTSPILVHCSAGIGRTGVFAVLLVTLRRVEAALAEIAAGRPPPDAARVADLRALVADIRAQRAGCVQTPDQYRFCFVALLEWLRRRTR